MPIGAAAAKVGIVHAWRRVDVIVMAEGRQRAVLVRERTQSRGVRSVQVMRDERPGFVAGRIVERVQHAFVGADVDAGRACAGAARNECGIARIVPIEIRETGRTDVDRLGVDDVSEEVLEAACERRGRA